MVIVWLADEHAISLGPRENGCVCLELRQAIVRDVEQVCCSWVVT
jgi:hypothetical protein